MTKPKIQKITKVLFIRYSAIGDIILTTPVARWIKLQLNAEVHFLTDQKNAKLLTNNIYIDKIISSSGSIGKDRSIIADEGYSLIIDLHKSRRSRLTTLFLSIPVISFDKLNVKKWLAVNFKLDVLPDKHLVDRYAESLKPIGIVNDGNGLDYFIPESAVVLNLPNNFHALILGAAHFTKRIPIIKCLEIVRESRIPVVLIGGNDVADLAQTLVQEPNTLDLINKLSIDQSAYVISKAQTVVTGDTGMMHIAAALKKPIIILWGNTIPKFGMFPYYGDNNKINYVNKEVMLSCRPCSKIGFKVCPKGHHKCMNDQVIEGLFG
jgi:ADP-heptose:LPS heptosyltransferase